MEKVFENQFVKFEVDPQKHVCIGTWKPMYKDDEEWKSVKLKLIEIIKQYKITKVLACVKKSVFPTPPSLQNWFLNKIKEENLGDIVEQAAIVLPDDLIIELSLQQLGEAIIRETKVPVYYFKTKEKAYSWIN